MESLADFQNKLHRELAWRKREVSDYRALVRNADDSANHIFRSTQVMLCAHWEGFLKKAVSLYLKHVFSQDLSLRKLRPELIAVAFYGDVIKAAEAKYPGSELNHVSLAKIIVAAIDKKVFSSNTAWNVNTEGNPGTDVVDKILRSAGLNNQIGFDEAAWSTTKVFINEQLVADRHAIAHGQMRVLSKDAMLERSERLLRLLDHLNDHLYEAATERKYVLTS
ncbi:hypothetical protein HF313_14265 [Massilia atriviolacea]|uniref:MAE-28990/MAE-18760-like HEPN domain-containing protein n=1 Tax=Massilia atriviolacea TaxID=2495579 RepID=A0A430HQU4_9BURK|nr:MAE_28990/MAE_18760 family HEPN-like nuclease [Massilia atriviolacea]RSZ59888.1 hypothetical protein EJB06_06800 [Massilia atriviolacea]